MSNKQHLLYIVYGDNSVYYQGAIISFLSFLAHTPLEQQPNIIILSEQPEWFAAYPVTCLPLTANMLNEWSLNHQYHFRIKNRGLQYALTHADIAANDKVLFLDTDTYFTNNPLPLFQLIDKKSVLLFLNEGKITQHRAFRVYQTALKGKTIPLSDRQYQLSPDAMMWGSLMMGVMPNVIDKLEIADELMQALLPLVSAHTIEQFSFVEVMQKYYHINEGKQWVKHYSRHKQKIYAEKQITHFLNAYQQLPLPQQIEKVRSLKLSRPWHIWLTQKIGIRS